MGVQARCIFVFFMIFNALLGLSGIILLISGIIQAVNTKGTGVSFIEKFSYRSVYYNNPNSWGLLMEKSRSANSIFCLNSTFVNSRNNSDCRV